MDDIKYIDFYIVLEWGTPVDEYISERKENNKPFEEVEL